MKVMIASVELAPFAWTGGLGDVTAGLARALEKLGVEVRVIMPKHRGAAERGTDVHRAVEYCPVHMPWWVTGCAIDETRLPHSDVPVYMVEHQHYFDRDGVFGHPGGDSFGDNLERFVFFCRAVLASFPGLRWTPDVIHLNDWHTALLALYQRTWSLDLRTVYTAHQLGIAYHGLFPTTLQTLAGIDLGRPEARRFVQDGQIDLARAGLALADMANTVSERYAWEIAQPWAEEGVRDLIEEMGDRFRGILNGVDYAVWDPGVDGTIAKQYGPHDLSGKATCKAYLQRIAGLPQDPSMPLVGMVSRLDALKGFDILIPAMHEWRDAQFVFLGTGDHRYASAIGHAAATRDDVAAFIQFDDLLARHIYAGADMLLMPSRREPCGTSQMIALKYGTIPIAHATGGLADTVNEDPENQNGFTFQQYCVEDLKWALSRAVERYRDPVAWEQLVRRAMACDFSWERSARKYLEMYEATMSL